MTKMISIQIEETTHRRLQSNAVPLEDSHDTVINRALDALETKEVPTDKKGMDQSIITLDPNHLPNLSHTKIRSASVDGMIVKHPHWYEIHNMLIRIAMQRGKLLSWLRQECCARIIEGDTKEHNYNYLDGYDISVQETSARRSCQTVVNIASALSIPVKMELTWIEQIPPKFRGKSGLLRIG